VAAVRVTVAAILEALHELIAVTRNKGADGWIDINGVAEFLGYSVEYMRSDVIVDPDFPRPLRKGGKGHPRWLRSEVQAWARSQQS
jgi:predicted DNA-binding transcriptional regulator AlpA